MSSTETIVDWPALIGRLLAGHELPADLAGDAMRAILAGDATDAQIAGCLLYTSDAADDN